MKNEKFDSIISQSIDQQDDSIDVTDKVMNSIQKKSLRPNTHFVKRCILLVCVLLTCTTVVFAGVKTFELIELRNEDEEVVSTVEVIDTETNCHLDVHLSKEEFIRYADSISSDPEWVDKSFIVIDTSLEYPVNMDLRPRYKNIYAYDEIKDIAETYLMPETIGDYTFDSLFLSYDAAFPDEKEIEDIISQHPGERFVVAEIESSDICSVTYLYENDGLSIEFEIDMDQPHDSFRFFTSTLIDYEVIRMDEMDFFIIEKEYLGVSYGPSDIHKVMGENCYASYWYEQACSARIALRPYMLSEMETLKEAVDGETVIMEVYPEDTKERILNFSKMLHRLFNE